MIKPKALRTVRSHVGFSRLLHGGDLRLSEEGFPEVIGTVQRPTHIPRPYAFAPEWDVFEYRGQPVVLAETSHRCYQVFSAEGLGPVTPVAPKVKTRVDEINDLYDAAHALLDEVKGKGNIPALKQWYEDRLELARVKIADALYLEGLPV